MRTLPSLLAAVFCLVTSAPSQVVISEVYFTPQVSGDDEWIELRNLGPSSADISTWSLYMATDTPAQAQNYWFAFPASTVISSQSSLRVHWMVPYQPPNVAEIFTGNSVFHFLFGYGAEQLGNASSAAVALLSSQSNPQMNRSAIIQDWVTWGDGWSPGVRPRREDLAIEAGRWIADTSISMPRPFDSIALIYPAQAEPTPVSAFFHDASPTAVLPGNPQTGHNHEDAAFDVIERPPGTPLQPCTGIGGAAPVVSVLSVPASGNIDFGFRLDNLVPGQVAVLIIGVAEQETPWPFSPTCTFNVALTPSILTPYAVASTTIDQAISLQNVPAATLYVQAVAVETLTAVGFDPGHKVVIGS